MLGAEMLPLFFQILQQFTKPQHLILWTEQCENSRWKCLWMFLDEQFIEYKLLDGDMFPSYIKSAKGYYSTKNAPNKTLNKQIKKQTLPPPCKVQTKKQTNQQKSYHTNSQNKPQSYSVVNPSRSQWLHHQHQWKNQHNKNTFFKGRQRDQISNVRNSICRQDFN